MSIRNGVKDSLKYVQGHTTIKEKLKKVKLSLQDVIFKDPSGAHKSRHSSKEKSESEAVDPDTQRGSIEMLKPGSSITKDRKKSIRNKNQ